MCKGEIGPVPSKDHHTRKIPLKDDRPVKYHWKVQTRTENTIPSCFSSNSVNSDKNTPKPLPGKWKHKNQLHSLNWHHLNTIHGNIWTKYELTQGNIVWFNTYTKYCSTHHATKEQEVLLPIQHTTYCHSHHAINMELPYAHPTQTANTCPK